MPAIINEKNELNDILDNKLNSIKKYWISSKVNSLLELDYLDEQLIKELSLFKNLPVSRTTHKLLNDINEKWINKELLLKILKKTDKKFNMLKENVLTVFVFWNNYKTQINNILEIISDFSEEKLCILFTFLHRAFYENLWIIGDNIHKTDLEWIENFLNFVDNIKPYNKFIDIINDMEFILKFRPSIEKILNESLNIESDLNIVSKLFALFKVNTFSSESNYFIISRTKLDFIDKLFDEFYNESNKSFLYLKNLDNPWNPKKEELLKTFYDEKYLQTSNDTNFFYNSLVKIEKFMPDISLYLSLLKDKWISFQNIFTLLDIIEDWKLTQKKSNLLESIFKEILSNKYTDNNLDHLVKYFVEFLNKKLDLWIFLELLLNNKIGELEKEIFKLEAKKQKKWIKDLDELKTDFLTNKRLLEIVPEKILNDSIKSYKNIEKIIKKISSKSEQELLELLNSKFGEKIDDSILSKFKKLFSLTEFNEKENIISILLELFKREFWYYLYNTQVISVLLMLDEEWIKNHYWKTPNLIYEQINTWEWKSSILVLLASFLWLKWHYVDIWTSNNELADRDNKTFWNFYSKIWLKSTSFKSKKTSYNFNKDDSDNIRYMTSSDLAFEYLWKSLEWKSIFNNKSFDVLLIDEADNLLMDASWWSFKISKSISQNKKNILNDIIDYVKKYGNESNFSLTDYLSKWTYNDQEKEIINIFFSSYYKSINLKENVDYIVDSNTSDIKIIDKDNTWRLLENTEREWWLHNFLRFKHKLFIKDEKWLNWVISVYNLLEKYNKKYCISGTFWDTIDRNDIKEVYNGIWFDIPNHNENIRNDNDILYFSDEEEYKTNILAKIRDSVNNNNRVLFIVESIQESVEFYKILKKEFDRVQVLNDVLNIWIDWNRHSEEIIVNKAWESKTITIATNVAGRWTDIKPNKLCIDNWWLVTIIGSHPNNKRVEFQNRWRSARQWNPWETHLLVNIKNDDFFDDKLILNKLEESLKYLTYSEYKTLFDFISNLENYIISNNRKKVFYITSIINSYQEKFFEYKRTWKGKVYTDWWLFDLSYINEFFVKNNFKNPVDYNKINKLQLDLIDRFIDKSEITIWNEKFINYIATTYALYVNYSLFHEDDHKEAIWKIHSLLWRSFK